VALVTAKAPELLYPILPLLSGLISGYSKGANDSSLNVVVNCPMRSLVVSNYNILFEIILEILS
jgi:hypothetical protein